MHNSESRERSAAAPSAAHSEERAAPERNRRHFLGALAAAGVAGTAVGAGGAVWKAGRDSEPQEVAPTELGRRTVPWHGTHQAGITTPAQARLTLLALDLAGNAGRTALARLMRAWTEAAARLTAGVPVPGDDASALGSGPSSLTLTFGFGASMFTKTGLQRQRPEQLAPLPAFPGERIDHARSDGDLLLQVCADDALVCFHAARSLIRLARGTATVRWQMSGFTRSPGVAPLAKSTPRNLMGQLDGTRNPEPADPGFAGKVFVGAGDRPVWLRGGSYLVMRRIRMLLDAWDGIDTDRQQRVIGRHKDTGAPLSGGGEHTPPHYGKRTPHGEPVIPVDAHIRLAAPEFNAGAAMLRRGYSYDDGQRDDGPDAGLLFLAWQADPRRGFLPVQRRLAQRDALNRFIRHEASGLYAVPGGCRPDEYIGQRLLEA
ncbi:iron uptake transporter deferrochelatase/peroxidase subunit [Streptomyces angustmyceticus]|uniref:iron uptake transporter deferrochelatase/peroxidase subunit n=1 Tax=Streptomyces angustmyceticus TaxID=285578 RepID=UPI00344CB359